MPWLDLFVRLAPGHLKKGKTPLESFTSELFAYLLQYLLQKDSAAVEKILALLGIKNTREVTVKTDLTFSVSGHPVCPDLVIKSPDKTVAVMVKIDSDFQKREIEDYEQIQNVDYVCSLTKWYFSEPLEQERKIRWHEIAKILDESRSDDFLVNSTITFLTENDMAEEPIEDIESRVSIINDALAEMKEKLAPALVKLIAEKHSTRGKLREWVAKLCGFEKLTGKKLTVKKASELMEKLK